MSDLSSEIVHTVLDKVDQLMTKANNELPDITSETREQLKAVRGLLSRLPVILQSPDRHQAAITKHEQAVTHLLS